MDFVVEIFTKAISLIGLILFTFWGWVPLLGYIVWQIYRNRRKTEFVEEIDHMLIQIIVPKANDKKELAAEQMFASLHGILRPSANKNITIQEHISFEIAAVNNLIHFFVWIPRHLKDYVEGQIYAQYPTVQIVAVENDYVTQELNGQKCYLQEVKLNKDYVFPIKTFPSFEVDPLAGITSVLAKLDETEQMWIQFLVRPVDDSWHKRGISYIDAIRAGKTPFLNSSSMQKFLAIPAAWMSDFAKAIVTPPSPAEAKKSEKVELSTGQSTINAAVEAKIAKLGYEVKIRACYIGDRDESARARMQALIGGFKQFNTINLNGFEQGRLIEGEECLSDYRARYFDKSGFILNIEELASLYHLPHTSVETPNIAWTNTKVGEPPSNLPTLANTQPQDLSLIGNTTFRVSNTKFGIKRADRMRHLYIVGKSGVGKSMSLQLLALSDIYQSQGFAIVDPHGDLAQDIMRFIPKERVDDVVYFNPADLEYPISFNPMENNDPNMRASIASEIVGVLLKMFGNSWGPRLEHILRFTLLALLESPDATLLGITRMLTDKGYRKEVVNSVNDPVVKAFWVNEFASWNEKFASEAVAPVLNKVGAFTANPLIRNVLGQTKSSFDIRKLMDEGKILIVDLSRGRIGEDNASILGALVITKIQLAAMSRANIALTERKPFYLYVDEFQNFATESFAVILSEARKYGLYLTVANQYVAQMPEEVRDAVFGNVGSMICFRVGATDAAYLSKYFEPIFEPNDLVNLNIQDIYVMMSIDGQTSTPFSARTLRMPESQADLTADILAQSREKYAAKRAEVENFIATWSGFGSDRDDKRTPQSNKEGSHSQEPDKPTIPAFSSKPSLQVAGASPKRYSQQLKKSEPRHHHNNNKR